MKDISEEATERFSDDQRKQAQQAMQGFHAVETEKTPSSFLNDESGDSVARINALLRYSPDIKCYAVIQKRVFIQITAIRPSKDGKLWHCDVREEDNKKGTVLTLQAGGPLMISVG